MQVKNFRELVVWQKAMILTVEIYKITTNLPVAERYGLSSQMRRCAVSIPSNIAEGFKRAHRREQAQFMQMAYASAAELETQIELCRQLSFLTKEQTQIADSLIDEVQRMLNTVTQQLRS